MRKIVVLLYCIAVFTMIACTDEPATNESTDSVPVIASEELDSISEIDEITEELNSEDTISVSEEALESDITDAENNGTTDKEPIIEEEILEDTPITLMDTILFAQRNVNVRSGPGTDYEKLGTLSINQEVTVTGQDKETGWYQIEYNGTTAFVSDSYLGENKVVVSTPVNNTSNTTATNTQTTTTATNTQDSGNTNDSSDAFTAEDIENALQFGQQFGMY